MAISWISGAERLGDGTIGGPMDTPDAPPRAVWHTTESGAGDAAFESVGAYLMSIDAEPHLLYDPTTDRLGQFGPLDRSARALRNDGSTRTNRTGRVCVQVEVLARANRPFTDYWKPGPRFAALLAAARRDPTAPQGSALHRADVLPVERALVAEGLLTAPWADGSFGTKTKAAYAAWQRRCGFDGTDADGIPGDSTLRLLA
ncbi:peptidoglycan-binding protein [Streptomyces sp. NPDC056361]|uniref:peptidoglycan-binding domain-containing protein n=1 Tax=Streptomyces sp. NPDC056361 TaxID=3345795 RepID=UPI0035DFF003